MASKIEKLDNHEERITVEIPKEDFKDAVIKVFNRSKNRFNIPGFRKGKAPFPIVASYYGEGVFFEDALELVLDDAYQAALKETEAKPFSSPQVEIETMSLQEGVTFTAQYAAKPEVKLADYQGLKAYRPSVEVEDSEIDKALDEERLKISRLVSVDREVKEDDHVLMDYVGSVDGEEFAGGSAEDYSLEIGSGQFITGFEDQMIGHKAGEEFDIQVTFPEKYHAENLAGKEANFHINLKEVKERQMPDLDDEFIKDISEDCDTVEEYRNFLREKMEKERNERADMEFSANLLEQIAKEAEFGFSELMIQDEMRHQYQEFAQMLSYNGMSPEDFFRMSGMNEAQYMAQLREPALQNLRRNFALAAVADAENIEVSAEEVQAEMERMAEKYGMPVEKLDELYDDKAKEKLSEQVRLNKASEYLRSISEATDELPEEEQDEVEEEVEETVEDEVEIKEEE